MNAMGIRSLAIVAGIGVSLAANVNAVERSAKTATKVQEQKTAFFGLPFFGGCNTGYNVGGYGGGYGCYPRPACGVQPCYPRPYCGTPYPAGGGYVRPYPVGMPAYGAPAYGVPAYGVPAYGGPAYGVPAYGAPGYYGPYGMNDGVSPVSTSPYVGTTPVINTSGYRSPALPSSFDDPYFP